MADYEYSPLATAKFVYERCLSYRRAMSRSSDADHVFSVLDDASEDPFVPIIDFVLLCDYADEILERFSTLHSDK